MAEGRRLSLVHRFRLPLAALGAALLAAMGAAQVLASCGDVDAATLSGTWQLRITVSAYTGGPAPGGGTKVGTESVADVALSTSCTATGQCVAEIAPVASGVNGAPVYDSATGFYWNPATSLAHSASTFSGVAQGGGFGGPGHSCHPPAGFDTYPTTLTVLQAALAAPGAWQAVLLSGTQTDDIGWNCSAGVGVVGTVEHLSLLAVPMGTSFPASSTPACALAATGNPAESSISSGLATPADAFSSPGATAVNAAITLGVILFVTFPSQLFNKTFEENYDDIRDIALRRFGWLRRFRRRADREAGGWIRAGAFALTVLCGAALASLNDPGFGLNGHSAATYLAVVLSILTGVTVGGLVGALYRRLRRHPVVASPHALPAGLLVAAGCVLVSRLTAFEPGYLYGVIAGIAFQGTLPKNEQGHTAALGAVASLTVAVVAWLIWVPVGHAAAAPGAAIPVVVVADMLASIFVSGLVGTVITLMPLRLLPGAALAAWNRPAWAVTFGIATFGLVEVVLHPGSTPAHPAKAAIVTAILLFAVFGGMTVGFRWYFSRRRKLRESHVAAAGSPATATPDPHADLVGVPPRARRATATSPPEHP
ncbi:MAG: FGLLP motif-containing membrane protein [Candidatus Dormibacteria bacterium]